MEKVEIPDMPFLYDGLRKRSKNIKVFQCPECKRLMLADFTEETPDLSCWCNPERSNEMEEVEPYMDFEEKEKE